MATADYYYPDYILCKSPPTLMMMSSWCWYNANAGSDTDAKADELLGKLALGETTY